MRRIQTVSSIPIHCVSTGGKHRGIAVLFISTIFARITLYLVRPDPLPIAITEAYPFYVPGVSLQRVTLRAAFQSVYDEVLTEQSPSIRQTIAGIAICGTGDQWRNSLQRLTIPYRNRIRRPLLHELSSSRRYCGSQPEFVERRSMSPPAPATLSDPPTADAAATRGATASAIALEIVLRTGSVLLLLLFLHTLLKQYRLDESRITLLILAIGEAVTIAVSLMARLPRERDWHPFSIFVTFGASWYFLFVQLRPGIHLLPDTVGATLQIGGVLFSIWAKLCLRRSFGLLPGNRGVVVNGPYRWVRHPVYLGYFIRDIGFLLPNFGIRNLAVILCLWALQISRIVREERLLSNDPAYRDYRERVRFRLLPRFF
ncbi:methyltransferase family protein [Paraburkholderia tropica]|uniref:methyltransferase family protein n=1 Tax=Paraburkholderia tropica TaxID=92647 RepID=UPI001FC7DF5F|nr:isoprenylcysteine carboxylmethyltransferase family protein [Paraburkholderia tropica]